MTDRARAATYLKRLLNDQDVQERLVQALRSGRDVYVRARGKSPAGAIEDKKLRRRFFESLGSVREAFVAAQQPPPPRKRRLLRVVLFALTLAGIGVAVVLKKQASKAASIVSDGALGNGVAVGGDVPSVGGDVPVRTAGQES